MCVILHWYTTCNECVFPGWWWILILWSFIQGRDKEQEDHELIPLFVSQLRNDFSVFLVLSVSVTGRQVLMVREKMSSVERPIRGKQRGMNWTNRNTVSSWFPIAKWMQSYQSIIRNMQAHVHPYNMGMWSVNVNDKIVNDWIFHHYYASFEILQSVYCIWPVIHRLASVPLFNLQNHQP